MSELKYIFERIDDGAGELDAHSAKCMCSNLDPEPDGTPVLSDAFYVFWDPRFSPPHLHIQCFDCEQTYCPYQLCVPPPTAEVIDPNAG